MLVLHLTGKISSYFNKITVGAVSVYTADPFASTLKHISIIFTDGRRRRQVKTNKSNF